MKASILRNYLLLTIIIIFIAGCSQEKVPKKYYPKNLHEGYLLKLKAADLLKTALAKEWIKSSDDALNTAIGVELPYYEVLYIDPNEAFSEGYFFEAKQGQQIEVKVESRINDSTLVFIDLFSVQEDSSFRHVATAPLDENYISFIARNNNCYILRIQPELLRGGTYSVTIRVIPSMEFPVSGYNYRAIQSFYGDPRDGGKRVHHGVDIFAPRHTEVVAPVDGTITTVGTSKRGGNTVWMYSSKYRANIYFAHLEKQLVKKYQSVKAGGVIGTVGNSGNAIHTPPHLHFGIYTYRNIHDPYYYLAEQDTVIPKIRINDDMLAKYLRTEDYISSSKFDKGLKILAVTENKFRVRLADKSKTIIYGELEI